MIDTEGKPSKGVSLKVGQDVPQFSLKLGPSSASPSARSADDPTTPRITRKTNDRSDEWELSAGNTDTVLIENGIAELRLLPYTSSDFALAPPQLPAVSEENSISVSTHRVYERRRKQSDDSHCSDSSFSSFPCNLKNGPQYSLDDSYSSHYSKSSYGGNDGMLSPAPSNQDTFPEELHQESCPPYGRRRSFSQRSSSIRRRTSEDSVSSVGERKNSDVEDDAVGRILKSDDFISVVEEVSQSARHRMLLKTYLDALSAKFTFLSCKGQPLTAAYEAGCLAGMQALGKDGDDGLVKKLARLDVAIAHSLALTIVGPAPEIKQTRRQEQVRERAIAIVLDEFLCRCSDPETREVARKRQHLRTCQPEGHPATTTNALNGGGRTRGSSAHAAPAIIAAIVSSQAGGPLSGSSPTLAMVGMRPAVCKTPAGPNHMQFHSGGLAVTRVGLSGGTVHPVRSMSPHTMQTTLPRPPLNGMNAAVPMRMVPPGPSQPSMTIATSLAAMPLGPNSAPFTSVRAPSTPRGMVQHIGVTTTHTGTRAATLGRPDAVAAAAARAGPLRPSNGARRPANTH